MLLSSASQHHHLTLFIVPSALVARSYIVHVCNDIGNVANITFFPTCFVAGAVGLKFIHALRLHWLHSCRTILLHLLSFLLLFPLLPLDTASHSCTQLHQSAPLDNVVTHPASFACNVVDPMSKVKETALDIFTIANYTHSDTTYYCRPYSSFRLLHTQSSNKQKQAALHP